MKYIADCDVWSGSKYFTAGTILPESQVPKVLDKEGKLVKNRHFVPLDAVEADPLEDKPKGKKDK